MSKGKRLTLIKSTLTNLPMYFLFALTVPVKIAKKLENIRCRFLWGDNERSREYHLMKWDELKKFVDKGGSGLRLLVDMNRVLKGKWLWRYLTKERRLSSRVIEARWVGELGRGFVNEVVRPYETEFWRKIGSERYQFLECIQWQLGRGNHINFLDCERIGKGSLRNQFPRIYAIAQRKNMVVEEWMVVDGGARI